MDFNTLTFPSLDSSGFEHVFVGETKSGTEIVGFHNWIQFYLQEKSGNLDYKGYKARNHDLVSLSVCQIHCVVSVCNCVCICVSICESSSAIGHTIMLIIEMMRSCGRF